MPEFSMTVQKNQTVLVFPPAQRGEHYHLYSNMLKKNGVQLIENVTSESAYRAMQSGCRVGLLLLTDADDLAHLERCASILKLNNIFWIGLISPELISKLCVRQFIDAHLFNFLTFPASSDHILLALRHAWDMALVRDSCSRSGHDLKNTDSERLMVGKSEPMQHLFAQITRVARSDATVLITGPSGTGKELAALSLHRQSARKNAPFIAVNCGAIAPQLLQSELFGYEKGSFTGAQQRRIGRIEAATGGALFLDEIGDMPLDMQVNLLRFLQERVIVRVGGTAPCQVDVRVIAATHIDLAEAVKQGRFREDLYYRINVVRIVMPKLAERGHDIEEIAQHYFAKFSRIHNKHLRGFSRSAIDAMLRHSWPGNVRELANSVQRAVVMAEGRYIQPTDLGFTPDTQRDHLMSLEAARASTDRLIIDRALSQTRNQISHAASLLGVSRVTLYRLIEKYNIRTSAIASPASTLLDSAE